MRISTNPGDDSEGVPHDAFIDDDYYTRHGPDAPELKWCPRHREFVVPGGNADSPHYYCAEDDEGDDSQEPLF